jgi:hypothetical protein
MWDSGLRKAALTMSIKKKKKKKRTKNYRPDFSSERAPHITKSKTV